MKVKVNTIVVVGIMFALLGCSAPGPRTLNEAGTVSIRLFGGQEHVLVWVPGAPSVGGAIASSLIGSAGLDSPKVAQIYRAISPATTTAVRIAISGGDSRFAAKATLAALDQVRDKLPKLSLAFVGDPTDAEAVRIAVEAKGGIFLFGAPS